LPRATYPDGEPDITPAALSLLANSPRCRPYSVLLPVGFTLPFPLPETRCALAAPFHPYSPSLAGGEAVRSLWHFPWGRPRRMLSGTACRWSPDFPLPRPFGACGSGRPADWRARHGGWSARRQGI